MNPLPFFPPPARAFSHSSNNSSNTISRPRTKSGSAGTSLRHTLSLSGSAQPSSTRSRNVSGGTPGTPGSPPTPATPPHHLQPQSAHGQAQGRTQGRPSTGSSSSSASRNVSAAHQGGGPVRRVATTAAAPAVRDFAAYSAAGPAASSSSSSPLFAGKMRTMSSSSSSSSASSPSPSGSASPAASSLGTGSVTPELKHDAASASSSNTQTANTPLQSTSSSPASSVLNIKRPLRSLTLPLATPSGRTGTNLPKGLVFEWVRPQDVAQCHALERASYDTDDAAPRDRIAYRQKHAPHLFLGAYVPGPAPKVAGPLSVGLSSNPKKLVGFINATASANLSARAIAEHAVSNDAEGVEAWLVCLHSIVVEESYRRRGLGLRMLEEYMSRLRRAEEGRGEPRKGDLEKPKGYECVALLAHEETLPFFLKAGFNIVGPSHVRSGSGEWIEMRRYIQHAQQKLADERKKVQQEELEQQKQLRRVASVTAASAASAASAPPALPDQAAAAAAAPTSPPVGSSKSASTASSSSSSTSPSPTMPESQSSSLHVVIAQADAQQQQKQQQSWQVTTSPTKMDHGIASAAATSPQAAKCVSERIEVADAEKSSKSSDPLAGFSQADLLAALSASAPSFKAGENPSKPFSTILGQTLAGKTFVEDAFVALEARLVNRRMASGSSSDSSPASDSTGTNLMEIWCPREECGCKLIAKGMAMWELAESGPLSQPEIAEMHMPKNAATLPPTPQPPPAPASHIRALTQRKDGSSVRSTLPGAPPSAECLTPIRPFWTVCSAMSFDNIGFSKDVDWKMPTSSGDAASRGSAGEEDEESNGGKKKKGHTGSVRRPTFRSSNGTRKVSGSSRPMSPQAGSAPGSPPSGSSKASQRGQDEQRGAGEAGSQQRADQADARTLTVKYLLCPNCDTGPLGYTIVPKQLTGGRMGLEVGEELGRDQQRAAGGPTTEERPPPPREVQIFLLAAERVRYRAVK
ncbi:unnamed protein product [Parajaminaea phylloscopi]